MYQGSDSHKFYTRVCQWETDFSWFLCTYPCTYVCMYPLDLHVFVPTKWACIIHRLCTQKDFTCIAVAESCLKIKTHETQRWHVYFFTFWSLPTYNTTDQIIEKIEIRKKLMLFSAENIDSVVQITAMVLLITIMLATTVVAKKFILKRYHR
jgi:hypothetical protein